MKLRSILLFLTLLAFLSAATGGYLYYSSVKEAAIKKAKRQAVTHVEMLSKNLFSFLSENIRPARTLAGMKELRAALIRLDDDSLARANAILDHFNKTLVSDVCYLMDQSGVTIASSNRRAPNSFVGKNFDFRPYFQQALDGAPATYLALGTTSGVRGVYFSHPIYAEGQVAPLGVVVIKAAIDLIERELFADYGEIVLVTDPNGVVFMSNRKEWVFHGLRELAPQEKERLARTQQFGNGPWNWIGLRPTGPNQAVDLNGHRYLMHKIEIDNYPGWSIVHLHGLEKISKMVSGPILRVTGPLIMTFCILVGTAAAMLYKTASLEISKRRAAEKALRESDERHRHLYNHTPAMLHSIDASGRLISVSDYWLDVMGYDREEVIGRRLTRFFTEPSRRLAEEVVFREFFKTGFCKGVSYQYVKKNGEIIDILLSAISERDEEGKPTRSLAVSVDVTEQKKAEAALKLAKEELSRYSRDLERQVRKRTREIRNILKYTPAVVYIKDEEERFLLVNSHFEEIFGVSREAAKGKMDHDIFPRAVADQIQANDRRVLREGASRQIEERVPQTDGIHTYLSVKFPIYNDEGETAGLCGILTDITELKDAQEQLRRLSGGIMASQEKERAAMARELHDELGQVLTALRMDSVWIRDRLMEAHPEAAERALTMCGLIDKTIQEVRGMAFRLRPGVLDDLGLVDALESFTADFERHTEITCIFEHSHIPEVTGDLATASYRIAQEALTNVARHSGASRVEVELGTRDGVLTLSVEDDGRGFSRESHEGAESLGLAVMNERANLVGGVLDIRSGIGEGTRVRLDAPMTAAG